jgi:hypothetical protein
VNRRTTASPAAGFIVAGALCFGCFASLGPIAACGGRVDGENGSFSGPTTSSGTSGGTTGGPGQKPPGTRPPGRPPVGSMSNAAVASAIAEDYCKAFSSCCVGAGQAPIDVAKCREVTSTAVEKELGNVGTSSTSAQDAALCTAAIHARVAACAKEDIHWPFLDLAIFAPASIEAECAPLLPNVGAPQVQRCSATMPCAGSGTTCAVDECSAVPALGAACPGGECLDSARCVAGTCVAPATADVNGACATNDDCRLGLVCFDARCAPTREHPELATVRSSPYRIGSDTCRAYSYL